MTENMSEKTREETIVADIKNALHNVIDPELGISVVDLGLVYGVEVTDLGGAVINITLTTPACPMTDIIEQQIKDATAAIVPNVDVNWVWTPLWTMNMISEDGKKQLAAIGFSF
jgi:metal-sulfur cluster biosynthetic enzyme